MKNLKKILFLLTLVLGFSVFALLGFGDDKASATNEKTASECEIPAFAKAIGHEDQWLLHNGCPSRKEADKNTQKDAKEEQ